MRKYLVLLLVVFAAPAWASPPESAARNAILIDVTNDTVLYDKGADERIPPASMSKIMAGYMVFEALKSGRLTLDQKIHISEHAWRTQGSKTFVELGNDIKAEDLIRGMAVQSGNDATVALAEALFGTEAGYAAAATERGKQLGLRDTSYANATGMPDAKHYSTVRDLATLAQHLMVDFPEYYHYYSEKEFTYHGITQQNRNPLLYMNVGADGVKTGHTDESGYCLIGSAVQNGRRLLLVVAGLPDEKARADEAARLLQWGFSSTATFTFFKKGDEVDKLPVWLGTEPEVALVTDRDITLSMMREAKADMKVEVKMKSPAPAPIKAGQQLGVLSVTLPGQAAHEYPLLAKGDVAEIGFMAQLMAKAHYFILGGE